MRLYGIAAISDLLGDLVAYRSLRPVDRRLPGLADLAPTLGMPPDRPPRKGDHAYAQIVAGILGAARRLDAPNVSPRRLIVIGDTRQGDGGAFTTLCSATGWGRRKRATAHDLLRRCIPCTGSEVRGLSEEDRNS